MARLDEKLATILIKNHQREIAIGALMRVNYDEFKPLAFIEPH